MKAYFTVEAAGILPVVLGIYVFLIYGFFYQYDRCLLEQDVAFIAINRESFGDRTSSDRYLAWEPEETTVSTGRGKIQISGAGEIASPFEGLGKLCGQTWKVNVSFSCVEWEPVVWIRSCRKIMEEENATDRICEEP